MMKNAALLSAIIKTFKNMGGRYFDIARPETDLNGQPTGENKTIGRLYGISYNNEYYGKSGINIELPGMIVRGNEKPLLSCVKTCGEEPREGDTIKACNTETRIISARHDGVLITLTLEKMI